MELIVLVKAAVKVIQQGYRPSYSAAVRYCLFRDAVLYLFCWTYRSYLRDSWLLNLYLMYSFEKCLHGNQSAIIYREWYSYPSLRSHTEKTAQRKLTAVCFERLLPFQVVSSWSVLYLFVIPVWCVSTGRAEIETPLICRFPVLGAAAHYILVNVFGMVY